MVTVSYVYPNVSQMTRTGIRSGLLKRWNFTQKLKCEYIEVPADFAKTGKPLGKEAISNLYEKNGDALPEELKYILHTEPALKRHDVLKWYDKRWLDQFANMVIFLSEFLGKPASIIEIHPGGRRRDSFEDACMHIAISIELLLDRYEVFNVEPLILLENRTRQFVSSGREILHFWKFLSENYPHLKNKTGIVLDIQQLYTVTKEDFLKELDIIPLEALKGFHIHVRSHQIPSENDKIPWSQVFDKIRHIKNHIIINPEVLREEW